MDRPSGPALAGTNPAGYGAVPLLHHAQSGSRTLASFPP